MNLARGIVTGLVGYLLTLIAFNTGGGDPNVLMCVVVGFGWGVLGMAAWNHDR